MVDNQMTDMNKRDNSRFMPNEEEFKQGLQRRNLYGRMGEVLYYFSIGVAILVLITLFTTIINQAFGSIAVVNEVDPEELAGEGRSLSDLNEEELVGLLMERVPNRLQVIVRDEVSRVDNSDFADATVDDMIGRGTVPDGFEGMIVQDIRDMESDTRAEAFGSILVANVNAGKLRRIVNEEIVKPEVIEAWTLLDALINYDASSGEQARLDAIPNEIATMQEEMATLDEQIADLEAQVTDLRAQGADDNRTAINEANSQISALRNDLALLEDQVEDLEREVEQIIDNNVLTFVEDYKASQPANTNVQVIRYHSWIDSEFLTVPMSSTPAQAGIRTAILGSIGVILVVIAVTLPVGVGAALYLEEYANDSLLNRIIETNVRNLAGVPSIIYGLLGLSIFVRVLAPVMSGVVFGANVNVPTDASVIEDISEVIVSVGFLLDEDERYIGIEANDLITEDQADNLVRLFRNIGTEGIRWSNLNQSNLYGDIAPQRAATLVRDALELDGNINITVDRPSQVTEDMVDIDFNQSSIDYETFSGLSTALVQAGNKTIAGRTLLAAALTLALLILPIVIINAQEALRAVPYAYREASYGLGATKWQTIWRSVLPAAVPGIMTGTILAISRAVGETAPLIVVGASTFIVEDPSGLFSRFTVLPIQIYSWTARPQGQFQFIAAAAIVVLLSLVLILNAIAIILRERYSVRN